VRVCHVAPELLPVPPSKGGAIERWVRDASTRLAARGHEVHVVSRDHWDGLGTRDIDGVRYHFVRIPPAIDRGLAAVLARGLWYYTAAGRVLSRVAPDVVHHHSRPAGLLLSRRGAPAARQILSLHSMDYGWTFGYAGWDRRLFGRAFRASARVLCVSDFIRRHTLERYPDTGRVVMTVYNGVDGTTFRPPDARRADDGLTVLYVGRVEERKGVHVLLDAFERVIAPQAPDARLRIVGPHSYWDREPSAYYRQIVERCRAHPRIELRGRPTWTKSWPTSTGTRTWPSCPRSFPRRSG
jgi:spore coat protein SA